MRARSRPGVAPTDGRAGRQLAALVSNGHRLAFHSNRDGNYNIYTVNGNGTDLRRVTSDRVLDQWPDWSPNGKQIAFLSLRDGYPSVFLMSAEGETAENPAINLTPKDATDAASAWLSRAPSWSKNGRQIYFMSYRPSTGGTSSYS